MFSDECKEWRKTAAANKTWAEFKQKFTEAHQDLQESQATARSTGYAGYANAVTAQDNEAIEAITQLANATTADRTTIVTLTQQVKELQDQNKKLNDKLVETLEKLSETCITATSNPAPKRRERYYCWSCGSRSNHKGKDCKKKKEGHKDEATENNKMGGSTNRFR